MSTSTGNIQRVDDYLAIDHNINAWSDDSCFVAAAMLDELSAGVWTDLAALVGHRPADWIIRLLESSSSAGQRAERAVPLAVSLLFSSDPKVAQSAAETLEGMDDIYAPDESVLPRLKEIADSLSPSERAVVDRLMARAPA